MPHTTDIVYQGSLRCLTTTGDGTVTLITDVPAEHGGLGQSFSPLDLVGVALGTCITGVMAIVAERNGVDLMGTQVRVVREMADKPVRRIALLRVSITIPEGRDYTAEIREKLQRAIDHCPVKQSLHPDVQVVVEMTFPAG